ncbi:STAS domain-containing protein [Kitasatospora sp. NPDC004799]|uniref:STAS domain-containing protein n=1 Tax=Kitasatospora sp. NPDC004799 TaxID=3154460 RepID=UPI0033B5CF02
METLEFALGPLPGGAGPFLCDQLAALLAEHPEGRVVVCDVSALRRPAPADLDHLARLRLTARRAGRQVVLRGVGPRLRLLLVLTGLAEVFADEADG